MNQEVKLIEPERTINEDKLDEENILSVSDTENILSKNKEGPSSTDEGNKAEDEEKHAAMKNSTVEIRAALGKKNQFKVNFDSQKDADEDWMVHTIYSLLREFEYGNMERSHRETWYQSHVWSMIESCFDKLKGVEAAIGESASLGSKRRMNENRHISVQKFSHKWAEFSNIR